MKVDLGYRNDPRRANRVVVHADDVWCAKQTLATVIAPVIERLLDEWRKDVCQSCPTSLMDEDAEDYQEKHMEACKEWECILEKILWAMRQISRQTERPHVKRPVGMSRREWAARFLDFEDDRVSRAYEDLETEINEYREKVKSGCELLGKYFRDLWI